jgi:hypothetical protein
MREKGHPSLGGTLVSGSRGSREERTCSGFRGKPLSENSLPGLSVKPKTQVQAGKCVLSCPSSLGTRVVEWRRACVADAGSIWKVLEIKARIREGDVLRSNL